MATDDPHASALASPTAMGQTAHLTRVDGAAVAAVCWERLPYYARAVWGSRATAAREDKVRRYLSQDASPVGLALGARSETLSEDAREVARARLATLGLSAAKLERLERHFLKLMKVSRSRLLTHISVADRANPELDRLDLLGEVVALRNAQADVQAERSLARAFRAMFQTRDPFVVWILVCLCFGVFIVFSKVAPDKGAAVYDQLVLSPDFERPWTLLTYGFLHLLDDWRHVTLNMLSLILVGQVLEQVLGHVRFLLLYMACAVAGGLASVLFKQIAGIPFATVGASGAISGLAGMALFMGLWFQGRYGRIPLRYTTATLVGGVILVSNVLLSATSGDVGTDHGAHLGGLAIGAGFGALLRKTLQQSADVRFAQPD